KATVDTTVLQKNDFDESDYTVHEILPSTALNFQDRYTDTMMYKENENSEEPVRLLTTVFLQDGRYYKLQVATSMVEEDDLVRQLFYSILWLYLGLVTTIILFNNFLLKRIWQPFYQLLKQLKAFNLNKPVTLNTTKTKVDEFKLLNETVQKLLQRNVEVYTSQKQFIENASHELQTPLAISINKLESLAEKSELPDDQLQLLASAIDNLERLTRLNKSLLLLSKIENKQFAEVDAVNINELTATIISDFSDQATFSNVEIKFAVNEPCFQSMNKDIAAVLITNLIKNAIIHNKPGGIVIVTITKNFISVENSGSSQPLDGQKIFDRFHKNELSTSSTGLGLSIVKAIAELYLFHCTYRFDKNHIVTISFR
ncbi:MAG: HAMP domain-containing sensor histidine kinase, partial [Chitinophagaceae bacterium]